MANQTKALRLRYENGMGNNGKPKLATRTFNDVVPTVDDAALKSVVGAINNLTEKPAVRVETVLVTDITE